MEFRVRGGTALSGRPCTPLTCGSWFDSPRAGVRVEASEGEERKVRRTHHRGVHRHDGVEIHSVRVIVTLSHQPVTPAHTLSARSHMGSLLAAVIL
jgi:hypothetical protein